MQDEMETGPRWKQNVQFVDREQIQDNPKYEKIDLKGKTEQVNMLLQQIPNFVAAETLSKAFVLKIPNGLQGELMRLKQGGYSSLLHFNGKINGTASLYPVNMQAVCLSAFSALSVVTGQFFLARIHKELKEINGKLTEVLDFLYNEKLCELEAEFAFLYYAYDNYFAIMDSEIEKSATLSNIQAAKTVAYKNILFFRRKICTLFNQPISKKKSVTENMYVDYLSARENFSYSLNLYCISSVLEVFYAQNFTKDYVEWIQQDIEKIISDNQEVLNNSQGKMECYINACKGLDEKIFVASDNGVWSTEKEVKLKELDEKTKMLNPGNLKKYVEMLGNIQKKYNADLEIGWCDGQVYLSDLNEAV